MPHDKAPVDSLFCFVLQLPQDKTQKTTQNTKDSNELFQVLFLLMTHAT